MFWSVIIQIKLKSMKIFVYLFFLLADLFLGIYFTQLQIIKRVWPKQKIFFKYVLGLYTKFCECRSIHT